MDDQAHGAFVADWRGRYRGTAPWCCARHPREEVSDVMRTCAEAGIAIVPQGGNTGLVGGAMPVADAQRIVLSACHA